MSGVPSIDMQKCNGCGLCVLVCPGNARTLVNGVAVITNPEACMWCTMCEVVCPTGAASCGFEIVVAEHTVSED